MPQSPSTEVPEYRVLQRSYFSPETVEPGARIRYAGLPGNHLEPLNDAARAKMEEFYSATFPERDPKTNALTGKQIEARAGLRPVTHEQGIDHLVDVVATAEDDGIDVKIQSLAEVMAAKKSTNQRPPPARVSKYTEAVKEVG